MGKQASVDLTSYKQTLAGNKTQKNVRRIKADEAGEPPANDATVTTTKTRPAAKPMKDVKPKKEAVKEEAAEMKSLTFSGKAPVDSFCSIKDKVHVFCEGSTIWDAMLNQVLVQQNINSSNNNNDQNNNHNNNNNNNSNNHNNHKNNNHNNNNSNNNNSNDHTATTTTPTAKTTPATVTTTTTTTKLSPYHHPLSS
ncbi:predicted protein [Nematostella vectensis]|uniref:Uncharacterized protein n=1 Tax=Nematostella vectensis TaxID=45351 RepID=A7T3R0_NEMVE|nr:predicted protein [Nematostella vectensis]|eukprot:XP_001621505.1 hypothetical protein NEMVEDRAFT_v1g221912 [Nematostella vectensis]